MDFDILLTIENETERTAAFYNMSEEDERLTATKARRVEFITTVKYVEKYLSPGSKIIDIGAGTGVYSLYFAKQGHHVTAVELAEGNIAAFKAKITPGLDIDLRQGNACDLSAFANDSFDVVLLFGPLYHISNSTDRQKCLDEARRVCKPGGVIFFAYISNDMVILTQTFYYDTNYLKSGLYNHETFDLVDFPFVFHTVTEARDELVNAGVELLHEVAVDGVSELLADKINEMDDESYTQYLRYHFYCCEKPEMLGRSNHLLFVGRNL
ncbi:MAG: class I SAM-dependent methyltransferase [Firmicutes bacterium]|nr:class I SAM-dependent methyltransferase [Bacillota bacterium]